MFVRSRRWWLLVLAIAACDDTSALSRLGDGCVLDSDCSDALVCVFRSCHAQCASSADCDNGARCVRAPSGGVCQRDEEVRCALHSDCPSGQVCAADAQCRDECLQSVDCLGMQLCVHGTCAEPEEVDPGGELIGSSGDRGEGAPCSVSSQCDAPLSCIEGKCLLECVEDRDCPSGECKNGHCIPWLLPEPPCVPGQQRSCVPTGHCAFPDGIEKCLPNKTWGPCQCLPPSTTSGGAGMGGSSAGGAGGMTTSSSAGGMGTGGMGTGGMGTSSSSTTGSGGFGGAGGMTTSSSVTTGSGGFGGAGGMTTSSTGAGGVGGLGVAGMGVGGP